MINYEDSEYHLRRHSDLLEDEELRVAWSYFADLAYFQHVVPGQCVLEYGGGLGNNLLSVAKRVSVCMVEPSRLGREVAESSGIEAVDGIGKLSRLSFDTILCRHVLEHVEDPLSTLQGLRRLLARDGKLILVVPCENMRLAPSPNDLDHHLYCWSPRTLSNLLGRAGYVIDDIRYEYFGAKRKLLPVFRAFGGRSYAYMVRLVGQVFRFKELVIVASPPKSSEDSE